MTGEHSPSLQSRQKIKQGWQAGETQRGPCADAIPTNRDCTYGDFSIELSDDMD